MCHHRGYTPEWRRESEERATDDEEAAEETATDELPSFLNEEASEDVEVLTDGGDGEKADES